MEYEPFKIHLGPNTVYTPDWVVWMPGGSRGCIEVKEEWGNQVGGYRIAETVVRMKWAQQLTQPWGWIFELWTYARMKGQGLQLKTRKVIVP